MTTSGVPSRAATTLATLAAALFTSACAGTSGRVLIDSGTLTASTPAPLRAILGFGTPQDQRAVIGEYTLVANPQQAGLPDYTNGWTFPLPHSPMGRSMARTQFDKRDAFNPKLEGDAFVISYPVTGPANKRLSACANDILAAQKPECNTLPDMPTYAFFVIGRGVENSPYNGVIKADMNCRLTRHTVIDSQTNVPHVVANCRLNGAYAAMRQDGAFVQARP